MSIIPVVAAECSLIATEKLPALGTNSPTEDDANDSPTISRARNLIPVNPKTCTYPQEPLGYSHFLPPGRVRNSETPSLKAGLRSH